MTGLLKKQYIAIIADDPQQIEILKYAVELLGYQVLVVKIKNDIFKILQENQLCYVLVDIGQIDLNIYNIINNMSSLVKTQIIALYSNDNFYKLENLLNNGIEDCIRFPISIKELIIRLKIILNRQTISESFVFKHDNFEVNYEKGTAMINDKVLDISFTEYRILCNLLKHRDTIVSSKELMIEVWGNTFFDSQILRVNIGRLRKKLNSKINNPINIITENGGYILNFNKHTKEYVNDEAN